MSEKLTDDELRQRLRGAPAPGTLWQHYKGGRYWVTVTAVRESTQEPEVVYHRQGSDLWFVRPLAEWAEEVESEGGRRPRFTPLA